MLELFEFNHLIEPPFVVVDDGDFIDGVGLLKKPFDFLDVDIELSHSGEHEHVLLAVDFSGFL